ncbi:MAG: hypothetical protein ACT4QG_14325 [Sporichthyaceae bacterium]
MFDSIGPSTRPPTAARTGLTADAAGETKRTVERLHAAYAAADLESVAEYKLKRKR